MHSCENQTYNNFLIDNVVAINQEKMSNKEKHICEDRSRGRFFSLHIYHSFPFECILLQDLQIEG